MGIDRHAVQRCQRYFLAIVAVSVFIYTMNRLQASENPSKDTAPIKYDMLDTFRIKTMLTKTKPINRANRIRVMDPYKLPEDDSITCTTLAPAANGETICTYPSDKDEYISKTLNLHNVWEADIVDVFKTLIKDDPYKGLIDIGVNLGVYAITAASMGNPVVGVEAYPPNLKRLAKSLRMNTHLIPLTKVVTNAVSDKYETMYFWSLVNHPGATQLRSVDVSEDPRDDHRKEANSGVETILADDLVKVIDFKRAVLKIDIEGGEFKFFQRAGRLFDEVDISHVLMEWDNKGEVEEWAYFFVRFFKDRGYTVHTANAEMKKLELSVEACGDWPFDVIFIKSKEAR